MKSKRIKKILKERLKEAIGKKEEVLELYDDGILHAPHVDAIEYHIEALESTRVI